MRKSRKAKIKDDCIVIYTDGSLVKNNAGGWAGAIEHPGGRRSMIAGAVANTTNNVMEMTAVIESVKTIKQPSTIVIKSDSELVVKGASVWKKNWKRNNYKTANGKSVKNKELWEQIDGLQSIHKITFEHVPAHCDQSPLGNVIVDELARSLAMSIKDK